MLLILFLATLQKIYLFPDYNVVVDDGFEIHLSHPDQALTKTTPKVEV